MIGLGSREVRYEMLVQRLLKRADALSRRIVCLSAIFASGEPFQDFTAWLRSDRPGNPIESKWRPTRQRPGVLVWNGTSARLGLGVDGETPFVPAFVKAKIPTGRRKNIFPSENNELVLAAANEFVKDGHRVLVYCPSRRSVESLAELCLKVTRQGFMRRFVEDSRRLARAMRVAEEWLGSDHVATRSLANGVAVHHGALPRAFLTEIESLLNDKMLPVAIASPTLAQGIDLSCSALIFQSLHRSGESIPPEEYANVVGRAGRAFVDLDGLSIYPIYDAKEVDGRMAGYNRLRRDAQKRTMQSGILLLVEHLTSLLAMKLGTDLDSLREYVLNVTGPWVFRANPETKESKKLDDSIESGLADLDTAILAAVENLDCDATTVADELDSALVGSLWRRRLDRMDAEVQALQHDVLASRANWIWKRTTGVQRRGFFAAGIGCQAGAYIEDNLDVFVAAIVAADAAILDGKPADAVKSIEPLAEGLFKVHPFDYDDLPASWKDILKAWVLGTPVGKLVAEYGNPAVQFIQDGIVYRLVWGIEAVRVHAVVSERYAESLSEGALGLILTHGMPTVAGALIIESGLPSRQMATEMLAGFPGDFATRSDLVEWLGATVVPKLHPVDFWDDEPTRQVWSDYLDRWSSRIGKGWRHRVEKHAVKWDDVAPDGDSTVRVIHDDVTSVTKVCGLDLVPIGELIKAMPWCNSAHTTCRVEDGQTHISIELFGPE